MTGRRQLNPGLSSRARWTAAATGLAVGGSALAIALIPAGAANAKPAAQANYHAGSDKAVFTATGVEDSNCLISTGGSTVYIKPGDRIDFSTGLAGVSLNGLNLQGGQVAGLDVTARLDGGASKGGSTFKVPAGKTVKVQHLSSGTHTLAWSAKSVSVTVPQTVKKIITKVLGPLGGLINKVTHKVIPAHALTIPLSVSQLKSGADLSWTGKVYVTKDAAKCTISVQTPKTKISAGPLHVTVPGQNVTVPGVTVPSKVSGIPSLSPSSSSPKSSKSSSSAPTNTKNYQAPSLTVPQMVVPQGDGSGLYNGGGGGYDLGLGTDNGTTNQLSTGGTTSTSKSGGGSGNPGNSSSTNGAGAGAGAGSNGATKTVDLASNDSSSSVSAELPVLLAIIAVLALAMVAGTYARLYLLGRKN